MTIILSKCGGNSLPPDTLPLFLSATERERRERWSRLSPEERLFARRHGLRPNVARVLADASGIGGAR